MTKAELIAEMAADANITKEEAKMALESFLGNIEESLSKGNRVSLTGFGSWSVTKREARIGRNPSTGEKIKIGQKKIVKFKPSIKLIKKGTGDGGPRSK
ncbi:HU family DNA-binding protein [Cytophaga sp. FL35]|uniref:HU family DNA-binding protein n=1 Tax=Cytophaga sp. FL35 TaxID=1904456 RepID=UPI001653C9EA|nr:HU family DNA-binding protein [Cytophaga sp. FL35]MBC7000387.1 HU family DNA-binding protein [Cytophaga sp. FL35]